MSRRKRGWVAVGIVLALVGTEVGLNLLKAPTARVQVMNQGVEPITGLLLDNGSSRATVRRIEPGESAVVQLSGRRAAVLKASFQQRGNALAGFQVDDFHPADLERNGMELVLEIRNNEFMRYQQDSEGEPRSGLGRFVRNVRNWVVGGFETAP